MYRPLHDYLVKQGYMVRGEVRNCDIAAVKGEDLVVVEMKRSPNVQLLAQAAERQKIAESVYVAVPRPANKRRWNADSRGVQHLLRRLELGLILVSTTRGRPPVEVVFHPVPYDRRRRRNGRRAVIEEIERRSADFNQGGSCRRKIATAYRESAIHIACALEQRGPMSPKALRALGTGEKTLSILYRNVYGWFDRVDRGLYALNAAGLAGLEQFPGLTECYRLSLPSDDARERAQGYDP